MGDAVYYDKFGQQNIYIAMIHKWIPTWVHATRLKVMKIIYNIGWANILEQPYRRWHPIEVLLDKRSVVCMDLIFFLYQVNWGMRSIQSYAPLRVMRQFCVIQDIPLWSIIGLHVDAFTLDSLERRRNLQAEWGYTIDLEIGEESWCTQYYYA